MLANLVGTIRDRVILDVGTGTGRAALLLARGGANVTAVDASSEMLAVARRRATEEGASIRFLVGDAHALDFPDRSFDVALSLRVIMHTPHWRQCIAELCRVAERLVIVDYPSAHSFAAIESIARRVAHAVGFETEPYRVFTDRTIAAAFASHGFRIRSVHRQFVLPIAFHKAIGSRRFTMATEALLDRAGLLTFLDRLSRSSPNGARSRNRRNGIYGRPPGAHPGLAGPPGSCLSARRDPQHQRARHRDRDWRSARPGGPRDGCHGDRSRLSHRRDLSAGGRVAGGLSRSQCDGRRRARRSRRQQPACAAWSIAARSACTATSSTRPPTKTRRSGRATSIRERSSKGSRLAREAGARLGIEVTIARPSGIYGPGDRRLLKLFRGVARRRWITLGRGKIYYHLTYIDDLVEGFRLCGEHPAAANRTYILAGGEVTTLERAGRDRRRRGRRARAAPASAGLAVLAGRGRVRSGLRAFRIEPPIYRRRVDFFTKSRAFDISRARREIGYAPQVGLRDGMPRTLEWYRAQGWL